MFKLTFDDVCYLEYLVKTFASDDQSHLFSKLHDLAMELLLQDMKDSSQELKDIVNQGLTLHEEVRILDHEFEALPEEEKERLKRELYD